MKELLEKFEVLHGYRATPQELTELYYQGELQLSSDDENTLIKWNEQQ